MRRNFIISIICNKPDSEIRFPILRLLHNDRRFLLLIYAKKLLPLKFFEIHVFKIGSNSEFPLLPIDNLQVELFYNKKRLLVSVEEGGNFVELDIIWDATSTRFARYGKKVNNLEF